MNVGTVVRAQQQQKPRESSERDTLLMAQLQETFLTELASL